MAGYFITVLICSTALSPQDCEPDLAIDVVRGPPVNSPITCALEAQARMGRADFVQTGRSEYMKIICTRLTDERGRP